MTTTRCAVWVDNGAFQIEERPVPAPGPGQVQVKVHACGVCLTDVHSVDGYFDDVKPPRVLGHEYGGVIEAFGPDVTGLDVGQSVVCVASGGFSERVIIPADRVFPISSGISLEEAAFVEPPCGLCWCGAGRDYRWAHRS